MLSLRNSTGEAYIEALQGTFATHQSDIIHGKLPLCLQPRALEYLAQRIAALVELERLKQTAPVEYLQARVATLQDYKSVDNLRQLLARVPHLMLNSTKPPLRDPTRVVLTPFSCLRHLEIRNCDLSTTAWQGLREIQGSLKSVMVYNSLEALHHLLAPQDGFGDPEGPLRSLLGPSLAPLASPLALTSGRDSDTEGPPCWPTLTRLVVSFNSVVDMDESLQLLPKLCDLCLSDNNIARVDNLQHCTSLTRLDLSYNRLRCTAGLAAVAPTLRNLRLQGAPLSNIEGVEGLFALEELDLRDTLLAALQDIVEVCKLPRLQQLRLAGAPLSRLPTYRLGTLSMLSRPQDVLLDGRRPSRTELATLQTTQGLERVENACWVADVLQQEGTLWQDAAYLDYYYKRPCRDQGGSRGGPYPSPRGPLSAPPLARQHSVALGSRSSRAFGQVVVPSGGPRARPLLGTPGGAMTQGSRAPGAPGGPSSLSSSRSHRSAKSVFGSVNSVQVDSSIPGSGVPGSPRQRGPYGGPFGPGLRGPVSLDNLEKLEGAWELNDLARLTERLPGVQASRTRRGPVRAPDPLGPPLGVPVALPKNAVRSWSLASRSRQSNPRSIGLATPDGLTSEYDDSSDSDSSADAAHVQFVSSSAAMPHSR